MKRIRANVLLLLAATSCAEKVGAPDHDEHREEGEHRAHAGEVKLSADAVKLAGIRVESVERRALGAGAAIPAEVQFEATSTAHVGPLVPGRFTQIAVAQGDKVRKNQLLGVVASSDVSVARARLDQAQSRLAAAEAGLRRQQQLTSEGIGAQRALVEAQAQVGEQRAEVNGLRQQLSVFGSGSSGDLKLVSPIEGIVVELLATLGETASADQAAFVVTDPTRVWVRGNVPELEIERVKMGMVVLVRLHAFPDAALSGSVTYIAPALEERTRSLPIRVTLDQPDPRLRSGLVADIELVGGARDERVLVVPTDALATLDGQQVVFVPADEPNTFKPQALLLGRRGGAYYEVLAGLKEGQPLVVSGAFTLKSALKSGELAGHEH
ncbi:MAG TPA: efflux RND transporter periplasmic adaptor subunit [Polyangiales bacterium]|nr:efflux RND transporter periplasmic adaptor subunit [Polyangiales bacterium]